MTSATATRPPKTTSERIRIALRVGAKQIGMDEDAYRQFLARHGARPGRDGGHPSTTTMTDAQLAAALDELRDKGFEPAKPYRPRSRAQAIRTGAASGAQIDLIGQIWRAMHEAGVVRDGSTSALRAWCKTTSRRHSPDKKGYDAPELMPAEVAQQVIEALKRWARRTGVQWQQED